MLKNRRGFTLMELVVVVLIMGILASMGVPYYYKTIETSKATDAVAIAHLIGSANRMYLVDNPGATISGLIDNSCNNPALTCATAPGACKLVACNYVAKQDWASSAYNFYACSNGGGAPCCANGPAPYNPKGVACVARKAGAPVAYANWGYRFFDDGSCQNIAPLTGLYNQPPCPKF